MAFPSPVASASTDEPAKPFALAGVPDASSKVVPLSPAESSDDEPPEPPRPASGPRPALKRIK
jgi:stringent starvation protein B